MKFNRAIMDYIGNWAKLKGIPFAYTNNVIEDLIDKVNYVDCVNYTDWKFFNEPDENIILSGRIVWGYLSEEPLHLANRLINEVEKKLNGYGMTGGYVYPARHNGKSMYQSEYWTSVLEARCNGRKILFIQDVIFNEPATIVFWKDGTKTVVKAQDGEEYDPEKGLAMAISKKAMGNNRDYYLTFKKYLKKYYKPKIDISCAATISDSFKKLSESALKATEYLKSFWHKAYIADDDQTILTCKNCGHTIFYDGELKSDIHFPCPGCIDLKGDNK